MMVGEQQAKQCKSPPAKGQGTSSQHTLDIPKGWSIEVVPRRFRKDNKFDTFWYSPLQKKKFRSRVEVDRYLKMLEKANGDEDLAFKYYKEDGKKKVSTKEKDDTSSKDSSAKKSKSKSTKQPSNNKEKEQNQTSKKSKSSKNQLTISEPSTPNDSEDNTKSLKNRVSSNNVNPPIREQKDEATPDNALSQEKKESQEMTNKNHDHLDNNEICTDDSSKRSLNETSKKDDEENVLDKNHDFMPGSRSLKRKSHLKTAEMKKFAAEERKFKKLQTVKQDKQEEPDDTEIEKPIPTENGGYSHTKASKAKISKANKGKQPWNKGKERSAEDRAKISASVRERHRQELLKKLEAMGMTEEEWLLLKRQQKIDRERKRRANLAAKRKQERSEAKTREGLQKSEKKVVKKSKPKEKLDLDKEKEKDEDKEREEEKEKLEIESLKKSIIEAVEKQQHKDILEKIKKAL